MKRDDFRIGEGFSCGARRWRCTDIGTRVIVAICLESHTVNQSYVENDGAVAKQSHADDPSWFAGPPYAVVETVFDENDIVMCMRDE